MGDSMDRTAVILAVLSIALWAAVQSFSQTGQQTQPAAGQTPPAQSAATQGAPTQPAGKRPLQFKTDVEQQAWKAATANMTDPAAMEKAADDFATKFPDSEVRGLLYKNAMRVYQNANNAEKTEAMGRKVLSFDGDDPEALTTVAEVIAERTHDTDLDKDQRFDDALKMAQKALQTVDTDVSGVPQDKLEEYKSGVRAQAYSTMGAIEYNRNNFQAAQANFQKALDAFPSQPYPPDVLRLALALDRQQKYDEALKVAARAVELTQENTPLGGSARRERDRLQQLTGGAPPAQPASQPPKN
jgi:tetratricopeptide (TPR) repeat protein